MSACQSNPARRGLSTDASTSCGSRPIERLDEIIAYCLNDPGPASFLEFETALLGLLRSLGVLADPTLPPGTPRPARPDGLARTAAIAWRTPPPGGRSRPVAGRSPMSGPSSCRATAAGPACTRWTSRWA